MELLSKKYIATQDFLSNLLSHDWGERFQRLLSLLLSILFLVLAFSILFVDATWAQESELMSTANYATYEDEVEANQELVERLTHITPDAIVDETKLDEAGNPFIQPVYPTRHVAIPMDPLNSYRWHSIALPEEWVQEGLRVEIWDYNNRVVPGYVSHRLQNHIVDLSRIDASRYPSIRVVLWYPNQEATLDYAQPIYFYYTSQSNSRLWVLGILLLLIGSIVTASIIRYRISVFGAVSRTLYYIRNTAPLTPIVATEYMVITIVWSAVFGGILSTYVGGTQLVYLLIKTPFLLLAAFLFSFASSAVLSQLVGIRATVQEMLVQSLSVIASMAVGLASFSPLLLFLIWIPRGHDAVLVWMGIFFVAAGCMGALRFYYWLHDRAEQSRVVALLLIWFVLYAVVFLQLGWMLRPWVGVIDPIHGEVPFSRLDGGNAFVEIANAIFRL